MRNNTVDIIRGFAMLLVVLGHAMSGTVREFSDSVLFQAIWTLQMPLFIIISGYVTRYSHPLINGIGLWKYVKKRTLAYLLPWLVWSIVVRGLILGQTSFLDLKYMLWHMDSGYWFLITLWTITMIFGMADLLSNKWFKNKTMNVLSHLSISGVGLVGLMALGYFVGMDFFAIKLTLYYLPIYLMGYFYGQIQDWLMERKNAKTIINSVLVLSLGLWLATINRINFFSGTDNLTMISSRFVASVLGCIAVTGLMSGCYIFGRRILNWMGIHTLEIYLTHYLFLSLVPALEHPILASMEGLFSLLVNFVLTIVLTIVAIRIIQGNKLLNYLLYAKQSYVHSSDEAEFIRMNSVS